MVSPTILMVMRAPPVQWFLETTTEILTSTTTLQLLVDVMHHHGQRWTQLSSHHQLSLQLTVNTTTSTYLLWHYAVKAMYCTTLSATFYHYTILHYAQSQYRWYYRLPLVTTTTTPHYTPWRRHYHYTHTTILYWYQLVLYVDYHLQVLDSYHFTILHYRLWSDTYTTESILYERTSGGENQLWYLHYHYGTSQDLDMGHLEVQLDMFGHVYYSYTTTILYYTTTILRHQGTIQRLLHYHSQRA